ncbi:hypothetical protein MW887_003182 [Aspergillus wentii]|nr:hypothetical protein MW887_003182 [Aspergillus wentii]
MRRTFHYPGNCESVDETSGDGHVDDTRPTTACKIHYGLIASGNKVIKDSKVRDVLSRKHGILCFEMEAAGLMNDFPCLVVRGICDYADARKNKQWQGYASLTAAAYAKELLGVVHTSHVENPRKLYLDRTPHPQTVRDSGKWAVQIDRRIDEDLLERITSYDHERIHQRLSRKKLVGTTQWFLDHPDFHEWISEKTHSSLWCSGKIGSGKSIIATAVVEEARMRFSKRNIPIVFVYCDEQQTSKCEALILSSLIKQISTFLLRASLPVPQEIKHMLHRHFGRKRQRPTIDDLQTIFTALFTAAPKVVYILDGLDSLDQAHAKGLLTYLQSLFTSYTTESKILFLSRDHLPGNMDIAMFVPGIRRVSTSENTIQDISVYIESSIMDKMMMKRITDSEDLVQEMKRVLLNESSGMFLWVYLQIEIIWQTCATDAEIRYALKSLPEDLEETYRRCITRINTQDPRVVKALSWVRFATRPLHIDELREAIAFDVHDTRWDHSRIPRGDFVMGSCVNLLVLDSTDSCVRFVHSSMNQYLDDNRASSIPGFPISREQGDMNCGEFCVAYLSFADFSLQIDRLADHQVHTVVPSPFILPAKLPGSTIIKKLFPGRATGGQSMTLPFRRIKTSSTPSSAQYRFLEYAVSNWAVQTRHIEEGQGTWDKFKRLALSFNETWNFSPWSNGGRSQLSHLHGLFGWAIRENHRPLLNLALGFESHIRSICDIPLVEEGLPPLHLACHLGHDKIVLELLRICDVHKTGTNKYTPLHCAAAKGHAEVVDILLHKKGMIDVDPWSDSEETPLFLAARNGWASIVEALLNRGAILEFTDNNFQTPLIAAAASGHLAVVELLLEKGAGMHSHDSKGLTCVSWAIRNKRLSVLNILLEHDDRLSSLDNLYSELFVAIEEDHQEAVKLMVEKGLNPNSIFDGKRWRDPGTLLSWAIDRGNEDLVLLLIEKGAIPSQKLMFSGLIRQEALFLVERKLRRSSKTTAHTSPSLDRAYTP